MADNPTESELLFFAVIGRLTVAWARLEFGIDAMVNLTWRIGGHQIEPDHPRMLDRKLKYLRKFFKTLDMPDDGYTNYENLIDEVKRQSKIRHDIIHGVVLSDFSDPSRIEFRRLLSGNANFAHVDTIYSGKEVLETAKSAEQLASKTFKWVVDANEFLAKQNR